jgi:mannose-1-phosphate guanylyltransferase
MKTAVLIAAGGTGTRLWPLSNKKQPKQFVNILGDKTLLRQTFDRMNQDFTAEDIFVSTSLKFEEQLQTDIPEIKRENIIYEPISMDTGPAICLATAYLSDKGYDKTVYISCDHQISNVEQFLRLISIAIQSIDKYPEQIALIGLNPTYASTALGYIEMGDPVDRIEGEMIFKVNSFREKPDLKTAEDFVSDWKYLWNASYFIYRNDLMLEQFKKNAESTYEAVINALKYDFDSKEFEESFSKSFKQAFDYMILEKTKDIIVLPANIGWSDVGTYKTVYEISEKDEAANSIQGKVRFNDLSRSLVINKTDKLIAIHGVKDLVVIQTEKATLITSIERSEELKKLIEKLEEEDK